MKIRLQKDQRGMGHVIMIVVVVVVLALVGGIGWYVMNHNKKSNPVASTSSSGTATTNSPAKTSTTSVENTCISQLHDSDLCKFEAAEEATPIEKQAYTATITTTGSGSTGSMTFKQDGKGNTEITTPDSSINEISLDGNTYVEANGSWIKYPSSSSAAPTVAAPTSGIDSLDNVSSLKFTKVDVEACGSASCDKYQFTDPSTGTSDLWFNKATGQLVEFSGSNNGATIDMKITYGNVNITAPSPVQDFSSLQE